MPVICHICHREGHKQKFCELYGRWGAGKEEGHILQCPPMPFYSNADFIFLCYANGNNFMPDSCVMTGNDFDKIITNCLSDKSFWSVFDIDKTKGNGHCFIYALDMSLRSQLPSLLSQNYTSLLRLLQDETNQNADMYVTLIGDADKEGMALMMENYVYSKHYKNKYADLLPFIMSNALQLEIIVIEYHDDKVFKKLYHFHPRTSREKRCLPLLLLKCRDHYEACLFIKRTRTSDAYQIISTIPTINDKQTGSSEDVDNVNNVNMINDSCGDEDVDMFSSVRQFRKTYQHKFIFVHVNINSFRYKFAALQEILSKRHVDFLAISESKLDNSFPDSQFQVDGFKIYRHDRSSKSGGLLLYIRENIPHRRLTQYESDCDGIEMICTEIKIGSSKCVMSAIYKRPRVTDAVFMSTMSLMAEKQLNYCEDLIILGDMNCCTRRSDFIKTFCEMYDMKNLIVAPTCLKGPVPTLLDVLLVTKPRRFAGTLNCECILSDFHNFIGAATKKYAPTAEPRKIIYRSYKNFNDLQFIDDVFSAPFHVAKIIDDVDGASWFTSSLLNDIIDYHAPCKTKVVKCESVLYMNSVLRKVLYKRNMARNKSRKYGKRYWEENRTHRNKVVSLRKN